MLARATHIPWQVEFRKPRTSLVTTSLGALTPNDSWCAGRRRRRLRSADHAHRPLLKQEPPPPPMMGRH
jgi:hypothetical protein